MHQPLICRQCCETIEQGIVSISAGHIAEPTALCENCINENVAEDAPREGTTSPIPPLADIRPQADEALAAWLMRVDPMSARFEPRMPAEFEPYTRGGFVGEWSLIFEAYGLLDRGINDAHFLVRMLTARRLGLKPARSARDFRTALGRRDEERYRERMEGK